MNQSILAKGLNLLDFENTLSNELEEKMQTYAKELMLFNAAYDLVGADNYEDIIVRHILDSLSAAQIIQQLVENVSTATGKVSTIADIGSGGGLPGIPLAAAMPNSNFILVERMSKRCAFLSNCIAILGLKNVTILNEQAERLQQNLVDVAVFRAFRPLDKKMIKVLLRILKPNGTLAAYKAKIENIQTEMSNIAAFVPEYKTIPLRVPFLEDHERHLVLVAKSQD
ncbi:MAG: 16S rRNA (guanine(527)-N(7))-methyltransferase RsmG [Spirochaetaceae bacterium]|nr:16S rRNA (guanine(527)-N(7))-methyltransferase RsmG [Spirochaetaceae bacterium]